MPPSTGVLLGKDEAGHKPWRSWDMGKICPSVRDARGHELPVHSLDETKRPRAGATCERSPTCLSQSRELDMTETGSMVWTDVGPGLARLDVSHATGLQRTHQPHSWSLCLDGVERAALLNCCPCCAWEVDVQPDAPVAARAIPSSVAAAYRGFAAGSKAPKGTTVLATLPPGRYWIVRSTRRPVAVPYVLLGNECVEAGAHHRLLLEGNPAHHALVVGAPGRGPRLDRPLVGVALGGLGGLRAGGVAFLSLALGGDRDPAEPAGTDLILVLPASGDLVLSSDDETSWEPGAEALARRLASQPASTRLDFRYDADRMAAVRVEREEVSEIQVVSMGSRVELCAAGARAVVVEAAAEEPDSWQVTRSTCPRLPDVREPAWDFVEPYLGWEEGSLARAGLAVFDALPAGDYVLVRVDARTLERHRTDGVGVEVDGLPGLRLALADGDVGQPLVGVAVLGTAGHEVVQLAPVMGVAAAALEASSGDAVVILPAAGPLVVDPGRGDAKRTKAWRSRARELARVLGRTGGVQ
jgi:hypothetical protein